MNTTKSVEVFHWTGAKYTIVDIPVVTDQLCTLEYYLQMLINEIERNPVSLVEYSYSDFAKRKLGTDKYTSLISSKLIS